MFKRFKITKKVFERVCVLLRFGYSPEECQEICQKISEDLLKNKKIDFKDVDAVLDVSFEPYYRKGLKL